MLDEGVVYRHPEQTEEVICWAENEAAISKVLNLIMVNPRLCRGTLKV